MKGVPTRLVPDLLRSLLRRVTLFLCLAGCPAVVSGQGLTLLGIPLDTVLRTTPPKVDRNYIVTYYRRLHLFAVSDRQDYSLRVAGSRQPLIYKPNLAWTLGAGIDYNWLGTEFTLKLPFLGYNVARKGRTKPFGLTLNITNRKLWFSTQYQYYKGFYLKNPEVVDPNWFDQHRAYPYRGDIRSQTVLGNIMYMLNPLQLSVPAGMLQRERQRKNAGSWVVGGFLTYQTIRADSSWVPTIGQADFAPDAQLLRYKSLALGLNAGYMQTLVFGNYFFTSFSLRPGLGVMLERSQRVDGELSTQFRLGWQGVGTLTAGYSTDIYYGGLYYSTTFNSRALAGSIVNTSVEYVRLVVGKRLRYQPKGIVKRLPGM
ncbi:MAG: DUF4421 family protein [Bacteroidetes bacterium]|nr:DUF4421 family protein [Fibrella sp.]